MTELSFIRDGWIDGALDDADERATFTRLKIMADKTVLTRVFSKRGGGQSEALNVPLLPLANYIARGWWPLLYEPARSGQDKTFAGRHRLDLPMHGYVFPTLALCSAGDEALLFDWAVLDNEQSPLKFLSTPPPEPLQISRNELEPALMDLVESALSRLNSQSRAHQELTDNWKRVRESLESPQQLAYCMAAGRLGIDPYDPTAPDIGELAEDLPEGLFNDISDAVYVTQLAKTTKWASEIKDKLDSLPTVDVSAFGKRPFDNLKVSPGELGYHAAVDLRARLGLGDGNTKAVRELFGAATSSEATLDQDGPRPMTGLIHRTNGVAHIGTVARSARQRHFRACAAAYIAWCSEPGEMRAGTVALTRRQQASRAFAAEIVAPRQYLAERAGQKGFTEEDIEDAAGKLIAPYDTVLWQAWRGGVSLWGIELPPRRRDYFF